MLISTVFRMVKTPWSYFFTILSAKGIKIEFGGHLCEKYQHFMDWLKRNLHKRIILMSVQNIPPVYCCLYYMLLGEVIRYFR